MHFKLAMYEASSPVVAVVTVVVVVVVLVLLLLLCWLFCAL